MLVCRRVVFTILFFWKKVNHIIFTFHYLNWLVLNPVCLFNMENYAKKLMNASHYGFAVLVISSRGIHSQIPHTTGYPYVYPGSPPNKVVGLAWRIHGFRITNGQAVWSTWTSWEMGYFTYS